MEYLMTYGWAILVIVIVLAVLLFLNPFKAPETCLFQQPGFSCSEALPQVYNDGTNTLVSLRLFNKQGQGVTIDKVVCTTTAVGDVQYSAFTEDAVLTSAVTNKIGAGGSLLYTGKCVDDKGTPLTLTANSQFKGIIAVWYNFDNDPDLTIKRQAAATLITTVLAKTT